MRLRVTGSDIEVVTTPEDEVRDRTLELQNAYKAAFEACQIRPLSRETRLTLESLIRRHETLLFNSREKDRTHAKMVLAKDMDQAIDAGKEVVNSVKAFLQQHPLRLTPEEVAIHAKREAERQQDFSEYQALVTTKYNELYSRWQAVLHGKIDSTEITQQLMSHKNVLVPAFKDLCDKYTFILPADLQADQAKYIGFSKHVAKTLKIE